MHILLQQFLILSFLAVIFYFLPFNQKKKDLFFMIIAFIPMWYIHSMVEVGSVPDLQEYERMFYRAESMTWKQCFQYEGAQETGYVVLNKIISLFSRNYYVFQGLYGFCILFIYFKSFLKYSPYAILSIIILLAGRYNMSICVVRQFLAVAIFVASIPLILERKLHLYLLVCAFCFFIHKTSIICLPVYFIYQMKPCLMFITSAFIVFLIYIGADMIAIMSIESFEDYMRYLEVNRGGLNWINAAITGIELGVFVFILRGKIWNDDFVKLLFVLLGLTFLVRLATMGAAGTVNRLGSYYEVASLFALPYMLRELKEISFKIVVLLIILSLKVYPTFFGSVALENFNDIQFISLI